MVFLIVVLRVSLSSHCLVERRSLTWCALQLIPFAFGWLLLAYASVRVLVTRKSLAKGQVSANPRLQMYATRYSIRSLTQEKANGKEK